MKKRAFERIPVNLEVEYSYGEEITHGTITNLSKNGMLVNTKICFPLHSKFEILFPIDQEVLNIPVKVSRVVRRGDFYDGMGVELLTPPKKYLEFVSRLEWNQIKNLKFHAQKLKVFICKICRHVAFEYQPISCPICGAPIEKFDHNPEILKTSGDFELLGEFEKKHFPLINISKEKNSLPYYKYIDVHVKVGEIMHVMETEDHIAFIDFYFDNFSLNKRFVARVSLNCNIMFPDAILRLNNATSGVLTVIGNCSAHGSWLAEATL